jgi:hypothetical protein
VVPIARGVLGVRVTTSPVVEIVTGTDSILLKGIKNTDESLTVARSSSSLNWIVIV